LKETANAPAAAINVMISVKSDINTITLNRIASVKEIKAVAAIDLFVSLVVNIKEVKNTTVKPNSINVPNHPPIKTVLTPCVSESMPPEFDTIPVKLYTIIL